MATTRTYEDLAGTLGRRVARVKEACGGAVGRKQPGGILGYPLGLIPFAEKMSESWNNPSVTIKKNGERKARRGFLGFNEDEYGDAAGRYGFFSGYRDPIRLRQDAFYARQTANQNERMYQSMGIEEYRIRAERYRAKAEELERMADERERGSKQRMADYEAETGNQVAKKRNGGNIGKVMNYTVYFRNGGLLPKSQRRVYQTGGKASAQDTMQQLYQLTQVAVSGSGQEQQQAMQALGQFVGEAMNGNEQYAQIIQAVFDGAKKGSREMTQMAQVFQSIIQQMQKREFGGRLDYITMLRNGGRPRYRRGGVSRSYQPGDEMEYEGEVSRNYHPGDEMEYEGEERTPGFFGRLGSRYKERQQRIAQRHQNLGENAQAFGNKIDDKLNEIGDMTLRDVGNGIVNGVKKGWELYTHPAHKTAEAIKSLGKGKQQASRIPYFIEREQY